MHNWDHVPEAFCRQLRQPLCMALLRNCATPDSAAYGLALKLLMAILNLPRWVPCVAVSGLCKGDMHGECMCACVCVCVGACACACACVHVWVIMQCNEQLYTSQVRPDAPPMHQLGLCLQLASQLPHCVHVRMLLQTSLWLVPHCAMCVCAYHMCVGSVWVCEPSWVLFTPS
jgi:hypothetical protein